MVDRRRRQLSRFLIVAATFVLATGLLVWAGVGAPHLDEPSTQAAPVATAPVPSAARSTSTLGAAIGAAPGAAPFAGLDEAALRAAIAEILREELAEVLATGAAGPAAVPAVERIRTAEEIEAGDEAWDDTRRVVDAALSSGRWTDEDAAALQAGMPYLQPGQRDEILRQLIPALNRGEIHLETDAPPF